MSIEDDYWQNLKRKYGDIIEDIDAALDRVEKILRFSAFNVASRPMEITSVPKEPAKLPCVLLPHESMHRSYNRDDYLWQIDECFRGSGTQMRSVALHGVGGVGKSHIALKYAQKLALSFDAVLWVYSATAAAISQSFTDIAVRLQLPNSHIQHPTENRITFLEWLRTTG